MERINFRMKRDFGEILEATFTFVRLHFFKITKSILVIAGIPLLIGAVWMGLLYASIFEMALDPEAIGRGEAPVAQFFGMIPAYILLLLGFLAFHIVINGYIALYVAGEDPSLNAVFAELTKTFWSYLGGSIVFMLMVVIGSMFCGIPGIYLWVNFVLMFIIVSVEKKGAMVALSRSGTLMDGAWWETFGLYIIVVIIQYIIAAVFSIPMYVIQFSTVFHEMSNTVDDPAVVMKGAQTMLKWMAVYLPIYFFGVMLVYMLLNTAVALKYFSLVEIKEGVGDMERIEQIGDL